MRLEDNASTCTQLLYNNLGRTNIGKLELSLVPTQKQCVHRVVRGRLEKERNTVSRTSRKRVSRVSRVSREYREREKEQAASHTASTMQTASANPHIQCSAQAAVKDRGQASQRANGQLGPITLPGHGCHCIEIGYLLDGSLLPGPSTHIEIKETQPLREMMERLQ